MLRSFVSRSRINSSKLQESNSVFHKRCLQVFHKKAKENYLEIGFGNGDNIIKQAIANKDRNFFGIETYQPGIISAKRRAKEIGINNVFFLYGDALDVLDSTVVNVMFSKIEIFFPDPWEKNKYKNRRLVNRSFIDLLARYIKPGGLLHFASDCKEYALGVLSIMQETKSFKLYSCYKSNPHLLRPLTRFEKRAIRSGETIFEFIFENK